MSTLPGRRAMAVIFCSSRARVLVLVRYLIGGQGQLVLPAQRVQGSFGSVVGAPTGQTTDRSPRRHEDHPSLCCPQGWQRCTECRNQREKVDIKVGFPSSQRYTLVRDGTKWLEHTGVQHQAVESVMGLDNGQNHVDQRSFVHAGPGDGQEAVRASGKSTDTSH